jgi:hypothetical protein
VVKWYGFLNRWNDSLAAELNEIAFDKASEALAGTSWDAGKLRPKTRLTAKFHPQCPLPFPPVVFVKPCHEAPHTYLVYREQGCRRIATRRAIRLFINMGA